jgi:hypothetical protein
MKAAGRLLPPLGHPLHLVLGFTVWAVWFTILYGGQSVGCAVDAPDVARGAWTWINGSLLLLTLATAVLLGLASWSTLRAGPETSDEEERASGRRFMGFAAGVLYGMAAFSTLAVGVPLLVLSPCV